MKSWKKFPESCKLTDDACKGGGRGRLICWRLRLKVMGARKDIYETLRHMLDTPTWRENWYYGLKKPENEGMPSKFIQTKLR